MIHEKTRKEKQSENQKKNKQKTNNKIIDSSSNIPVIILNENALNTPIKRQRLTEWLQKHGSIMARRNSLQIQRVRQAETERVEKLYHGNIN